MLRPTCTRSPDGTGPEYNSKGLGAGKGPEKTGWAEPAGALTLTKQPGNSGPVREGYIRSLQITGDTPAAQLYELNRRLDGLQEQVLRICEARKEAFNSGRQLGGNPN